MQEKRQPGDIAEDAIASITMISREAIRAIAAINVEAHPSPSVFGRAPNAQLAGTATGFRSLGADVAENATGEQVSQTSLDKATQAVLENEPSSDGATGAEPADQTEDQAIERAPAPMPQGLSPNDFVRQQMGGGGIAAVASSAPSPNDIIRGAAAPATDETGHSPDPSGADLDADAAEKAAAEATGAQE